MEWFVELFTGSDIAHTICVLALVISIGVALGKVKFKGISFGMTWVLFVGIAARHFNLSINEYVLQFVRDFGLVLFIFCMGLQVGPGFFSSFKKMGLKLNIIALLVIFTGIAVGLAIGALSGTPKYTMVGIMTGATSNTPALGAIQQVYADATGYLDDSINMGYAIAYPMSVFGGIFSLLILKALFKINFEDENRRIESEINQDPMHTERFSVAVTNPEIYDKRIVDVRKMLPDRPFVISRIKHSDGNITFADAECIVREGDIVFVVANAKNQRVLVDFFGKDINLTEEDWNKEDKQLVSRRIVITKPHINGRLLGDLKLRTNFGVNVTRVNRAGIDLVANANLSLQVGDRLTVVGEELHLQDVARFLGNSMKRLREPNLLPIFVGILLGIIVGSIPFYISGIGQSIKFGLAGGTLIVAILLGRFGPTLMHMVTYTTVSANLMLREVGLALFLAAVGISAGNGFIDTLIHKGGYIWVGYGIIITMLPVLIVGLVGYKIFKIDYFTLSGTLSGSMLNPFAMNFISGYAPNDVPAVSYSTVYPLVLFTRVVTAQLLMIFAIG